MRQFRCRSPSRCPVIRCCGRCCWLTGALMLTGLLLFGLFAGLAIAALGALTLLARRLLTRTRGTRRPRRRHRRRIPRDGSQTPRKNRIAAACGALHNRAMNTARKPLPDSLTRARELLDAPGDAPGSDRIGRPGAALAQPSATRVQARIRRIAGRIRARAAFRRFQARAAHGRERHGGHFRRRLRFRQPRLRKHRSAAGHAAGALPRRRPRRGDPLHHDGVSARPGAGGGDRTRPVRGERRRQRRGVAARTARGIPARAHRLASMPAATNGSRQWSRASLRNSSSANAPRSRCRRWTSPPRRSSGACGTR